MKNTNIVPTDGTAKSVPAFSSQEVQTFESLHSAASNQHFLIMTDGAAIRFDEDHLLIPVRQIRVRRVSTEDAELLRTRDVPIDLKRFENAYFLADAID